MFYSFLAGLFALFCLAIIVYIRQFRIEERDKGVLMETVAGLRSQILEKEKLAADFMNSQARFCAIKEELEAKVKELALIDKFRQDLSKRDEELKNELANKQILAADFKMMEEQLRNLKSELALKDKELPKLDRLKEDLRIKGEELTGLKEQYGGLQQQAEALKQALALEKNLHQRLKEAHSSCPKAGF